MLRERWPLWKAGLYGSEVASLQGCSFPEQVDLYMTDTEVYIVIADVRLILEDN